jgi:hypothetical protein
MKLTRIATLAVLAAVSSAAVTRAQAPDPSPSAAPAVTAPAVAPAAPGAVVPPKTYYEGVEVTVSGKAKAAGVVVLVFQTIGGDPRAVSVNVLAKTGENDVARDLAKELTVAGGSAFKVKTKSGNVIVVTRAAKNAPNLSITLGMQTVPGIAVSFGEN